MGSLTLVNWKRGEVGEAFEFRLTTFFGVFCSVVELSSSCWSIASICWRSASEMPEAVSALSSSSSDLRLRLRLGQRVARRSGEGLSETATARSRGSACKYVSYVKEAYNSVCFSISELIFWNDVAEWLVLVVFAFVTAQSSSSNELNCKENKTR